MPKEFEIVQEFEVDASPQEVWEAITSGTGGWLWPMEYEPREGGAAPFGATLVAWDPPRRLTAAAEYPEGVSQQSYNRLDHVIEPREGGGSRVRYVHSGIFVEDWDNQYDGAAKHTDFYLHTLREYLRHFFGRPVVWAAADGPAAAAAGDAFVTLTRGLGVPDDAAAGSTVRVALPGVGGAGETVEAVVDYRNEYFLGLRTGDAMYRLFGRNHFGVPLGIAVHDFGPGADAKRIESVWQERLNALFA